MYLYSGDYPHGKNHIASYGDGGMRGYSTSYGRTVYRVFAPGIYDRLNTGSISINISSDLYIRRRTSSIRYKTNIVPITDEVFESAYDMRPITYNSKNDDITEMIHGLIAEEVNEIDNCRPLVMFENEETLTTPDGFDYGRLNVILIGLAKKQKEKIEFMEQKLANFKQRLSSLGGIN